MTRSKNPNPRHVTDEVDTGHSEVGPRLCDAKGGYSGCEAGNEVDVTVQIDESRVGQPDEKEDGNNSMKRDALMNPTAEKFCTPFHANNLAKNDILHAPEQLPVLDELCHGEFGENGLSRSPEDITSLNSAGSSPLSLFVTSPKPRTLSPASLRSPLRKVVHQKAISDQAASLSRLRHMKPLRLKMSSTSGMLDPAIMNWLRNRFEMKAGGKISASDVIRIYNEDMRSLPDSPPTLQNYQVGQLLRRVFPKIERCKITVNGKRVWVYRYLSLVHHDDPSILCNHFNSPEPASNTAAFQDGAMSEEDAEIEVKLRGSPLSSNDFEDCEMVDTSAQSPASVDETSCEDNEKKNNVILLGLLGQCGRAGSELPSLVSNLSPSEVQSKDGIDIPLNPFKKKRDSEVVEWLMENYKFKTGYFVKSMDLLHRYNNGREELVKYLSQVGRVMKHVFPGVRHLRKSFKGGKREWVYLNLKPIEVDSDSEEAKSMQMLNKRRSTQIKDNANTGEVQAKCLNWKHGRVNITHMPLSCVPNRNAIFKPRSSIYHSVSRVDGNKLIISRKLANLPQSNASFAVQCGQKTTTALDHTHKLQNVDEESVSRRKIILYNTRGSQDQKQDECLMQSDLECHIFAPITNNKSYEPSNSSGGDGAAAQCKSRPSSTPPGVDRPVAPFKSKPSSISSGVDRDVDPFISSPFTLKGVNKAQDQFTSKPSTLSGLDKALAVQSPLTDCQNGSAAKEELHPHGGRASVTCEDVSSDCTNDVQTLQRACERSQSCSNETASCGFKCNDFSHCPNSIGLNLTLKQEYEVKNSCKSRRLTQSAYTDEVSNVSKCTPCSVTSIKDGEQVIAHSSPTIHYRPEKGRDPSVQANNRELSNFANKPSDTSHVRLSRIVGHFNSCERLERKRTYEETKVQGHDATISWSLLKTFNARCYGWLRSPQTSMMTKANNKTGSDVLKYVEWFLFSGQWLVNGQRALREIKIYDDWTVVIHALGRRVYPNDLGGITDLEKTSESLNKVFRVLGEAQLCMGFPAPSISDLYIHGILVSKFEVWSSREDSGEDIRQRAVNCQILYSGAGACCNKCARIMRLHQQQRCGVDLVKRPPQTT